MHSNFDALEKHHFVLENVKIHYVAPMHVSKQGNQKAYYPTHRLLWITFRATWALFRAALTYPADVIIVGKPHPMNGLAGLFAKVLRRTFLVVDCDDYEAGSGRFNGGWQRAIISFFEKRVPRYADVVTTHTHFMCNNLISWGVEAQKIVYLPNGVDPNRFQPPSPERVKAEQKRLGLNEKKVVAYIGSLSFPSHPVNLLMEAFAKIHTVLPESVLLIVGGGENLSDLQEQAIDLGIESAVRFVGRVTPEDVPLYYALADVSTDPVYDDDAARGRSPLKMFESWICGIPFVTMDVGERAHLMGEPPAGILVEPGEPDALRTGIVQVLEFPTLAETLSDRGKRRLQHYLWPRIAQSLDNLLTIAMQGE